MDDPASDEFSDFVASCSPRLLWSARLLCGGDRSAAEDLVQDALVETYRRWSRIASPQARYAYARRVMVRMATKRWRKPSRLIEVTMATVPERAAGAPTGALERGVDVWAALAELSPKQRAVMVLRYYEDLREADIARVLGCSTGTVKTHASRALAVLSVRLSVPDGQGLPLRRTTEELT